ncbi:hypothetical protein J2X69_000430 [Algoriphagus sp. 4150]|uniref:RagB/SusD family nutrient uptake outer membrane protein n=1 Tax=Algoriphagus sp. 4150 TaxID=2817756 RepID=UPI00286763F5|nr:RagB/SusD family nutrient uptake outer membrane protein [Algoriphagus sp. 4150]MDR7128102.1 hypothetical protein [Algoriphagus sp. 4150]
MKHKIYLLLLAWILASCEEFLDEKPSTAIDTPNTLESLQAMLDYSSMNNSPEMTMMLSDEYFSDYGGFLSFDPWHQNLYIWKSEPFELDDMIFDWRNLYHQIQVANIVLERLNEIGEDTPIGNSIKGAALFYRANAYFNLYTLFLDGPNLKDIGLDLKIPFKISGKLSLKPELAGKDQIKKLIREDVEQADVLLPLQTQYLTRPSKIAAKALKARIYLDWEDYDLAWQACAEVMDAGMELIDYNDLDPNRVFPFTIFNQEVIWHSQISGASYLNSQSAFQVDSTLYSMYRDNDLRGDLFFVKRPIGFMNFRGSYTGGASLFSGLALNEIYLIYAECLERKGMVEDASSVLNELLATRYESASDSIYTTENGLQFILDERRKELVFRGRRWGDLRRINADERFRTTLKRIVVEEEYLLQPNSEKYALPIPARELNFY